MLSKLKKQREAVPRDRDAAKLGEGKGKGKGRGRPRRKAWNSSCSIPNLRLQRALPLQAGSPPLSRGLRRLRVGSHAQHSMSHGRLPFSPAETHLTDMQPRASASKKALGQKHRRHALGHRPFSSSSSPVAYALSRSRNKHKFGSQPRGRGPNGHRERCPLP